MMYCFMNYNKKHNKKQGFGMLFPIPQFLLIKVHFQ